MTRSLLPAEALASYWRDGFLFPLRVLSEDQAGAYRSACDAVLAALGTRPARNRFSQWHLCFRWAYDLALAPAILDAAEAVLGPNIIVHSSTMFFKPPDGRVFVPWHQDGHYWELDAPRLTSVWIALSPSVPETGCLRVVRGSHRRGRCGHAVRPDPDSLLAGLELAVEVDERDAVDVCLRPGEASLHHLDTVHGSRPNCGAEPRVGFAIRYAAAGVGQKRAHHDVVLARGEDRTGAFTLLAEPPPTDLEAGLARQRRVARWIEENLAPLYRSPAGG